MVGRPKEKPPKPMEHAVHPVLRAPRVFKAPPETIQHKPRERPEPVKPQSEATIVRFERGIQKLKEEDSRFADIEVNARRRDPTENFIHTPWFVRRWRTVLATAGVACLMGITALSTRYACNVSQRPQADKVQKAPEQVDISSAADPVVCMVPHNEPGRCVTPNDPKVLKAVSEAIKDTNSPLSMTHVIKIYDSIVTKIRYSYVADPLDPRWPSATLDYGFGDCKCISRLLASELEAIGAKTVLIYWEDKPKNQGHEYVGMLISDSDNSKERERVAREVTGFILRAYSPIIKKYYGGRTPPIQTTDARTGTHIYKYLLLDATARVFPPNGSPPVSVPGDGNLMRTDIAGFKESRPGIRGHLPLLK